MWANAEPMRCRAIPVFIVTLSGLLAGVSAARAGSMSVAPTSDIFGDYDGGSGDRDASHELTIQGSDTSFLRNGSDYARFSYKWTAQASADKTWLASFASVSMWGQIKFDFSSLPPALWTIYVYGRYCGVAAVSDTTDNYASLAAVALSRSGLAESLPAMTLWGAGQSSTGATPFDRQGDSVTTVLGSGAGSVGFSVGLNAQSDGPEAYAGLGRMSGLSFFGLDNTYYNANHGLYVTLNFTPSLDLAGHVLNEPLHLESGEVLSGYGTVNGAISGAAGSTIRPTGSGLVIGDVGSFAGFDFAGSVDATQGNLEVRDLDVAVFHGTAAVGGGNTLTVESGLELDGCTMTVADSGRVEAGPTLVVRSTGTVNLNGGTVVADTVDHAHGGTFDFTGGTLQVGTFAGNLVNNGGTVAPGGSVGTTTVDGDYTQSAGGTLEIELAGDSDYDVLDVTGTAYLGGALELIRIAPYLLPGYGQAFEVLTAADVTGTFDTVSGVEVCLGLSLAVTYSPTAVTATVALAADVNLDGQVDGADYTAWADHYGQSGNWCDGDFTGDGTVDGADYTAWADNYGSVTGGAAVPEPATLTLLALGGLALLREKRRPSR